MNLPSDLELTFLGPTDSDWATSVDAEVFDQDLNSDFFLPYLANPNRWLLLAWSGGRVVEKCSAIVHLRPDKPRELYVDEIDVTPAFRGRGIAKALMTRLLEAANEAGIPECWAGTENDNVPARALYKSLGSEAEPFVLYYLKD